VFGFVTSEYPPNTIFKILVTTLVSNGATVTKLVGVDRTGFLSEEFGGDIT
jgi:hypothetical protein